MRLKIFSLRNGLKIALNKVKIKINLYFVKQNIMQPLIIDTLKFN